MIRERQLVLALAALAVLGGTGASLVLAGVRHSFLPAAEKTALERTMRAEIEALAPRHLGRPLSA